MSVPVTVPSLAVKGGGVGGHREFALQGRQKFPNSAFPLCAAASSLVVFPIENYYAMLLLFLLDPVFATLEIPLSSPSSAPPGLTYPRLLLGRHLLSLPTPASHSHTT